MTNDTPLSDSEYTEALDEMLAHTAAVPEPSYEKNRADLASEAGFTGTFAAFLEWLEDSLVYGGIRVHEPEPNEYGRIVVKLETVTGGFSSDEHLLGRLHRSMWLSMHWAESHRGGLTVYEFPEWVSTSNEERVWLKPENDDAFETIARARSVRVESPGGEPVEFSFGDGVELLFQEPDRDITDPAGVLIVRPWSGMH